MITTAVIAADGQIARVTRMGTPVSSAAVEQLIRYLTAACDADQRAWVGAHIWHAWCGAWIPGRGNPAGALADHRDLVWVAVTATDEEPGAGMDWVLAHQRLRVVPHDQAPAQDDTATIRLPKRKARRPSKRTVRA